MIIERRCSAAAFPCKMFVEHRAGMTPDQKELKVGMPLGAVSFS